jgi:CheY-like chemotaxis protein
VMDSCSGSPMQFLSGVDNFEFVRAHQKVVEGRVSFCLRSQMRRISRSR